MGARGLARFGGRSAPFGLCAVPALPPFKGGEGGPKDGRHHLKNRAFYGVPKGGVAAGKAAPPSTAFFDICT